MSEPNARGSKKPGRQFEEIVAMIESSLARPDAKVKSPDHVLDKSTGGTREVDVTVRFNEGIHEFLIVIQCRDRGRKQGVEWIDELVSLKHDIGADLLVAVCKAGFSKGAKKKAHLHNIRLRMLEVVTPEEASKWLKLAALSFDVTVWRLKGFEPVFADNDQLRAKEFGEAARREANPESYQDTGLVVDPSINQVLTFQDMLQNWVSAEQSKTVLELPADATWKGFTVQMNFKRPCIAKYIETSVPVTAFKIAVELCRARTVVPAGAHRYRDANSEQGTFIPNWPVDIAKLFPNGGGVPLVVLINDKRVA